jgi:hypothetical protein
MERRLATGQSLSVSRRSGENGLPPSAAAATKQQSKSAASDRTPPIARESLQIRMNLYKYG